MPQTVYILCGLPFAGKTTLARELERQFGFRRVAIDEINAEFGLGLDGDAISAARWDRTYTEAYNRTGRLLAQGETVLFDAASFTRAQRDEVRAIAQTSEVPALVIFVDIPVSVARRRWLANRSSLSRHDVRDDDFAHVVDHFEPPGDDEHVLHYDGSETLAGWITRRFS